MRHDEQVRLIKQACAHLDSDTNVDAGGLRRSPTATYTDPAQADREWNEWFRAMPQLTTLDLWLWRRSPLTDATIVGDERAVDHLYEITDLS